MIVCCGLKGSFVFTCDMQQHWFFCWPFVRCVSIHLHQEHTWRFSWRFCVSDGCICLWKFDMRHPTLSVSALKDFEIVPRCASTWMMWCSVWVRALFILICLHVLLLCVIGPLVPRMHVSLSINAYACVCYDDESNDSFQTYKVQRVCSVVLTYIYLFFRWNTFLESTPVHSLPVLVRTCGSS